MHTAFSFFGIFGRKVAGNAEIHGPRDGSAWTVGRAPSAVRKNCLGLNNPCWECSMPRLIEYKDMSPRAKAVVDDIAKRRNIAPADINNVWKAMAKHPAVMERFAEEMKAAFAPGKLDPLTKELVYLAVSIANQCDYCIAS